MARENVTAYRITAEDATAAAWASAQRTASTSIQNLQNLIPGLAAALSGAGLVAFGKSGIDAADRLNDLSKSTAISVENLAGLQLLARQTGTDLDGLAKGINKMSVEMGKDPEKFRALGITAKDNTEAFKQFADLFNTLPDINTRNALAMSVFGKSWAGLAPALSEGGQRIGEIIERGTTLTRITQDMAARADEFNDKMAEFETALGGVASVTVDKMIPALTSLTNQFIAATEVSTSFMGVLGQFFTISGDEASNPATAIADIDRKLSALRKTSEEFAAMGGLQQWFSDDDIAIVNAQIAALEMHRKTLLALQNVQKARIPPPPGPDPAAAAAAQAKAEQFLDTQKDIGKVRDDGTRKWFELQRQIAEGETQQQNAMKETIKITHALEDRRSAASLVYLEQLQSQENAAAEAMAHDAERQKALDLEKTRRFLHAQTELVESLRTESEIEEQDYERKVAIIDERMKNDFDRKTFWFIQANRLANEHEKKLIDIEKNKKSKLQNLVDSAGRGELQSMSEIAGQGVILMQSKSRKMFEVGKVFALAQATINTAHAVTSALAVQPFPVGLALAAVAAAAGAVQIQAIKAQSFTGGGSAPGTVGTFSANPSTGLPESPTSSGFDAPANPTTQQATPLRRDITLTIVGGYGLTTTQVREELIPLLNDAIGDGVRLTVQ